MDEEKVEQTKDNKDEDITKQNLKPEEQKKKDSFSGVGIGIGLCLGVAFGIIFDNLALGIGIGLCFGVAFDGIKNKNEK